MLTINTVSDRLTRFRTSLEWISKRIIHRVVLNLFLTLYTLIIKWIYRCNVFLHHIAKVSSSKRVLLPRILIVNLLRNCRFAKNIRSLEKVWIISKVFRPEVRCIESERILLKYIFFWAGIKWLLRLSLCIFYIMFWSISYLWKLEARKLRGIYLTFHPDLKKILIVFLRSCFLSPRVLSNIFICLIFILV